MKKTFYSNGKLLLTGEYLVLDGALALALPTKFGQNLVVTATHNTNLITWQSFDADGSIWFDERITSQDIINNTKFENDTKTILTHILHQAYQTNPNFINQSSGYDIVTNLYFSRHWGLGTSSTLINNIAQWAGIDAFALLQKSFGGSGYDIACAQNNSAVLYQLINNLPDVKTINFNPVFKENIYFVYLNQKQNSKAAIENYAKKKKHSPNNVITISNITEQMVSTTNQSDFEKLITNHEKLMSIILETPTIQSLYFADFKGVIKSLGAWGGDFVMAVSTDNPTDYFRHKGYNTVLNYKDLIL